jgi:cell fate regulator YaaT (PSP1 superfamily)
MICKIQYEENEKIFSSCPNAIYPSVEDYVIFKHKGGEEIGRVLKQLPRGETSTEIIRIATKEDLKIYRGILEEEKEIFKLCEKKAKEMELPIKIASAHIQFDKSVLRIDFLAEKKVLLKRLVKEIAKIRKERIEFKQIGVRTYAKRFNLFGVCGRPICCGTFLREFKPVSIDLLKIQNLSCGTLKLTGLCGKLMCCLNYERELYEKEKKEKK